MKCQWCHSCPCTIIQTQINKRHRTPLNNVTVQLHLSALALYLVCLVCISFLSPAGAFTGRQISLRFFFFAVTPISDGDDRDGHHLKDAENCCTFRTDLFDSPKPFPVFTKSLHKDWSWHARRSGRPIRGVCRNCRLTLRSPWQLGLHDLPRQLCNYLGGKFSSRAACPLFPTNSASLGRNLGKRPHKKIFKILDNLKSDLFQARIMGISWEVESIFFAVFIA